MLKNIIVHHMKVQEQYFALVAHHSGETVTKTKHFSHQIYFRSSFVVVAVQHVKHRDFMHWGKSKVRQCIHVGAMGAKPDHDLIITNNNKAALFMTQTYQCVNQN